jgi:hypothetical protein
MFNEPPFISIDDLDAIQQYGWELPVPNLVPTPVIYFSDRIQRPDTAMLLWYEAVLLAVSSSDWNGINRSSAGNAPVL